MKNVPSILLSSIFVFGCSAREVAPKAPEEVDLDPAPSSGAVVVPEVTPKEPVEPLAEPSKVVVAEEPPKVVVAAPPTPEEEKEHPTVVRDDQPLSEKDFNSILIKKSSWVRVWPAPDAPPLGTISKGTRIAYKSHVKNETCPRPWLEVSPRGWVCERYQFSRLKPTGPKRRAPRALPGEYGLSRGGSTFYPNKRSAEAREKGRSSAGDMFKRIGSFTATDGTYFWRTQRGELISEEQVRKLGGSKFEGGWLGVVEGTHSAFVVGRNPRKKVPYFNSAETSRAGGKLKLREMVKISEADWQSRGERVRLASGRYVETKNIRLIEIISPPVGATGKWVDVNLDTQVVVIYDGPVARYATLASTGKGKDATPTGLYRVTRKKPHTTMVSDRSKSQTYSVSVPWAVYFHEGYAFHSAYWHNKFGQKRSHGCINLAPKDALLLYQELGPGVPVGWHSAYSHDTRPGAFVNIREPSKALAPVVPAQGAADAPAATVPAASPTPAVVPSN